MKYLILVLVNLFVLVFYASAQQGDISPDQFLELTGKGEVQVLDVRTSEEYKNGHITNALQADWLHKQQFADRVQYLDKTKPVLVYCASGGRSGQAAKWLSHNGFNSVVNLKGGFTEWKMENKPVEGVADVPQLTMEQYNKTIAAEVSVLIDFGAVWCPPCKKMEPVLEVLRQDLKDNFKLVKVDGGINTNVMQQLDIVALPTFIIYKNGKEVWRKQGITDISEFKSYLQ